MASSQALPEPMNASPHHSKIKVTTTLADPVFVAGAYVSGKLEMECRADKGLGIGIMMVELFAIQELSSRDHSATSTFLHSRRLFQGPGLPPSNAVQAHPMPGDPPLPQHYYQARRGRSTFLFRIPIPASSPSSISFGSGLAKVRYEIRGSVGVYWKNEKRHVIDKHPVDVVESYPYDEAYMGKVPEAIAVGDNGKLWMHGRMAGSVVVAGESACLELQVKNHSNKKNTGLTLTVTRTLYLPGSSAGQQRPAAVQISDTLTTVPFRGPEYIIPPGAEGVANLVFDVPKHARGVRGGTLDGEESEGGSGPRHSDSLFEIKCKVEVKLTMGMGSKDISLEIPVEVVHPRALPPPQDMSNPYALPGPPGAYPLGLPAPEPVMNPAYPDYNSYYHMQAPASPAPPLHMPYIDPTQNQVWLPPPTPIPISYTGYPYIAHSPVPHDPYQPPMQPFAMQQEAYYGSHTPPHLQQQNLFVPVGPTTMAAYIPRPLSAGPVATASQVPPPMIPGLPAPYVPAPLLPLHDLSHPPDSIPELREPEMGKGERALRVTQHLRMSSRHRSVSPQSHRYPLPIPPTVPEAVGIGVAENNRLQMSDTVSVTATAGGPSQPVVPQPPLLLAREDNLSTSPPTGPDGAVVHSPRPQLTPKHSFTRDPVLGNTVAKSERVEELEKMADAVTKKSQDLSGDLPKGIMATLEAAAATVEDKERGKVKDQNKTLPGPPVPSGKPLLSPPPSRARADLYFSSNQITETAPLPSDQTPPTPALLAVLPSRGIRGAGGAAEKTNNNNSGNGLRTESGLDALERRLLAEVGTRKIDARDQRPDARNMLLPRVDTQLQELNVEQKRQSSSMVPIPIPVKSPEPLNDSAISSLTLAGGLGGDDSDGEFDGRTHKAGRSRSHSPLSGNDREGGASSGGGLGLLHLHMRERAEAEITTPTKTLKREREKAAREQLERKMEKDKDKEKEGKTKEGKTSGKKKDRSSNKSAAKGRVAAWLGRIDPDVPPQEQIIPPSPSVVRGEIPFADEHDDEVISSPALPSEPPAVSESDVEPPKEVAASPNPRSSGFVPIAILNRSTIQARSSVTRDATVVEEARKIEDLWASEAPPPGIQEKATPAPRFPLAISPMAPPQSIRTDRRVSPPSAKQITSSADPRSNTKPSMPLSYSAAARNVWKQPEHVRTQAQAAAPPPPPPNKDPVPAPSPPSNKVQPSGHLPVFPPPKSVDPEVKYDIRSARGGRGGKVTSVANLWASGAINDHDAKGKGPPRRLSTVEESKSSAPPKPFRAEKKLFSAAVMTPVPPFRPAPIASGSGPSASKPPDAQKYPDSRNMFTPASNKLPPPNPGPKKVSSAAALFNWNPTSRPAVPAGKASRSSDALVQKRATTATSNPYSFQGKITPTNLSTPTSSDPKLHELATKSVKPPAIKATSDPAVVSSSHAIPTLSSTASLARPHISAAQKPPPPPRPVKLPTGLSVPTLTSAVPSEDPRQAAPSKPADLAFGQARLRDLIKKYQQRT